MKSYIWLCMLYVPGSKKIKEFGLVSAACPAAAIERLEWDLRDCDYIPVAIDPDKTTFKLDLDFALDAKIRAI